METVDYIDLLQGAADLCGLDRDNLSTVEQATLRNLFWKRLETAWKNQKWPDLCRFEKRYFRPVYASGTAYVAANEVCFPQTQACYQALKATTGNPPTNGSNVQDYTRWALCQTSLSADNYSGTKAYVAGDIFYDPGTDLFYQAIASSTGQAVTDTTYFAPLNNFSRYVSKEQTGKTAIGTVWYVWDKDRRNNYEAQEVQWFRSENGVQVLSNVPYVWIDFRLRAPVLSGSKWNAAGTYSSGQQVYYKSTALAGNMYTANQATAAGESPETNPEKWDVVQIPLAFKQYLELGAAADYLAPTEDTASDRYRMLAEEALSNAATELLGQEGQRQQVEVGVR